MAEAKKKVSKKPSARQVDSIIVILIVIIVLAVIAGGIVLLTSLKTPELEPLNTKPGLVTSDEGTYLEYLQTKKDEVGSKNVPLKSQAKGTQTINYVSAVLGTDDVLYFVSVDDTKNTETIPGSNLKGIKVLSKIVDIYGIETSAKFYLIALDENGVLYNVDLSDISVESQTFKNVEAIEVYAEGNQVLVKTFGKSTKIIIE